MHEKDKSKELSDVREDSLEGNRDGDAAFEGKPEHVLNKEVARLKSDLNESLSQNRQLKREIDYLEREIQEIVEILRSIKSSAGWKFVNRVRRAKFHLFPLGTRRRRLYDRLRSHISDSPSSFDSKPAGRFAIQSRECTESGPPDDYYQVRTVLREVPSRLNLGGMGKANVEVTNLSPHVWRGNAQGMDQRGFVNLSYHWLNESGRLIQRDGERSNLPQDLAPGASLTLGMKIYAPFETGAHTIQISPVCEGVAWFDEKGSAPACSTVKIEDNRQAARHSPSCSIIVPVFNSASLTKSCLLGIEKSLAGKGIPHEIIVVDNGSADETPDLLKSWSSSRNHARVIRLTQNLGFSRACNEGARIARGAYLVLLNNDTLPTPGWLESLIDFAEKDPKAGIVGSKLLYPDGRIQHVGVAFSGNITPRHIYRGFPSDIPPAKASREYQAVTGACLLLKRELFWKIGGMDETYWNLYEDMDLCMKVRGQGYRVLLCADSVLYHFEGMSQGPRFHDYRNAAVFKARWDGHVEMDLDRWHKTDGLAEEMAEFEPADDFRAQRDRWIKALWKRVYSTDVPEL